MDNKVKQSLINNLRDGLFAEKNNNYVLRKYHMEILKTMIEKYEVSNNFLCEMAAGTGKTILLIAAIKLLIKSKLVKKAMILVDTRVSVEQLIQSINNIIPEYSVCNFRDKFILEDKDIIISTIDMFIKKEVDYKLEEEGIDLVVFFSISQYISGSLLKIVKSFKGYRLGIFDSMQFIISNNIELFDNKKMEDTYSYFVKKLGVPDYKYSLKDAVRDGNLPNPISEYKSIDIEEDIYTGIMKKMELIKTISKRYNMCNENYYSTIKDIEILLNNLKYKEIENKELVEEFIKNGITKADIEDLGYKKKQLDVFEKLLNDCEYFDSVKLKKGSAEKVWQDYFESNKWIFGYGLNFIFTSSLKDKKLEQVVSGFNFNDYGKRVDALMYTNGIINSFIFVEIKRNDSKLLESRKYREGCWQISSELSGAVSQVQKSVQKAIISIRTKTDILAKNGDPTGETVFLYQPKAFIVIGDMKEFITDKGINEEKFSSFELFRKGLTNLEILTYDELYNRAKYIVKKSV